MSTSPRWSAGAELDGTFTVRRAEVRPGFDGSLPWHWEKPTLARAVLDGGALHLLELAEALASLHRPSRRGGR